VQAKNENENTLGQIVAVLGTTTIGAVYIFF
jgi:hypothetical protein